MIVVAHAGHWAAQLLYLAPVIAMLGAIVWAKLRGRGATEEEPEVSAAAVSGNEASDVRS